MNVKERNYEIDILKGLAIILFVMGHTNFGGTQFIYLFHMAVFFIASGYFYNSKKIVDFHGFIQYCLKKMKSLWFPYALWNTIFVLCNNLFIKLNVYTDNSGILDYTSNQFQVVHHHMNLVESLKEILKGVFFLGGTTLGGAFWFLRMLFIISILFAFIGYIIYKCKIKEKGMYIIQGVISVVFLLIGYYMSVKGISLIGNIQRVFSCYILYYLGILVRNVKFDKIAYKLGIMGISIAGLLVCLNYGNISLGSNSYPNPVFLLVASLLGWGLMYEIAYFITKIKYVNKAISCLGKYSLNIMILHFLAFKIVSYIQVFMYEKPKYLVASFPVLYNHGAWWVIYTIVGVCIPVLFTFLWSELWKKIKARS